MVDLYGQCTEVELKPLTAVSRKNVPPYSTASPQPQYRAMAEPKTKEVSNSKKSKVVTDKAAVKRKKRDEVANLREMNSSVSQERNSLHVRQPSSGSKRENDATALLCPYFQLCQGFVKSLAIPGTVLMCVL